MDKKNKIGYKLVEDKLKPSHVYNVGASMITILFLCTWIITEETYLIYALALSTIAMFLTAWKNGELFDYTRVPIYEKGGSKNGRETK